jgi:hypothetical protein
LWKTKSSTIEQKAKMEEDQEEDNSSTDIEDVQTTLSIGDVPLSKEYTVEHPIDVRSLFATFVDSVLLSLLHLCHKSYFKHASVVSISFFVPI